MAFLFDGRLPRNIDFNGDPVSKVVCGGAVVWEKVRRVKYIKSHGTEYIDTGCKPDTNTRVQMIFELYEEIPINSAKGLFGGRSQDGQCGTSLWYEGGEGMCLRFQYGDESSVRITNGRCYVDTKYIIDVNKNTLTCMTEDGEKILSRTAPECDFQSPQNMFLFAVNNNGTADVRKGLFKLYGCKIWDNGVLVRDFIPCLDGAGTPCLYDEVEQKFYYNSGTGNFETEE